MTQNPDKRSFIFKIIVFVELLNQLPLGLKDGGGSETADVV